MRLKINFELHDFEPFRWDKMEKRNFFNDFLRGSKTTTLKKLVKILDLENDEIGCVTAEQRQSMMGNRDVEFSVVTTGRLHIHLVNDEDPLVRQHYFDWPLIYRQLCDKNYPEEAMKFDVVHQIAVPSSLGHAYKEAQPLSNSTGASTLRTVSVTTGFIRSKAYEQLSKLLPLSEFDIMHWRTNPMEASRDLLTYLLH